MKECVKALAWSCHAEVWSVLDSGVFLESNDRDKGHDFWEPGAPWPTAPQSFAENRGPSRGVLLTEPLHGPLVRAAADPLRRSAEGPLEEQGYRVCCQSAASLLAGGDKVYHRVIFELRVNTEKRIRNRQ